MQSKRELDCVSESIVNLPVHSPKGWLQIAKRKKRYMLLNLHCLLCPAYTVTVVGPGLGQRATRGSPDSLPERLGAGGQCLGLSALNEPLSSPPAPPEVP